MRNHRQPPNPPPEPIEPEIVNPDRDLPPPGLSVPVAGAKRVDPHLLLPPPSTLHMQVSQRAVLDVGRLCPPGDPDAPIAVHTMLPGPDGWQAAPWWPGFYGGVGLIPVALDKSYVIEAATSVTVRGFLGRRHVRTLAWYWRVLGCGERSVALLGPFETAEALLRFRP